MCWHFMLFRVLFLIFITMLILFDWQPRVIVFSCLRMRSFDIHCFSLYLLTLAVSFVFLFSFCLTLFDFFCVLMRFWRSCLAFFFVFVFRCLVSPLLLEFQSCVFLVYLPLRRCFCSTSPPGGNQVDGLPPA